MSADLTPEQRVERVKMALAEAGWPDAVVRASEKYTHISMDIPAEVRWRARAVVGSADRCWECYESAPTTRPHEQDPPCDHDPFTSEWPPIPQRAEP